MNYELRLFDTQGERQPLPDRYVGEWEFELLPRGGYGTFSLPLVGELDESEITLPSGEWRFEVWFGTTIAYRGWVERVRPAIRDTRGKTLLQVEGAGRMARASSFLADCQYTQPGGADVADVYGWLAGKFLSGAERLGGLVKAIEREIGFKLEHVDLFGTNVRDAFDRLAEASQDLVIWGFDVATDGSDRLYVRKRPTSVTNDSYVFRVGKDVSLLETPADITDLVNAIQFVGGKVKAPNLVYNSSFELPFSPGDGKEGSIILKGGFEATGDWEYLGGAARQPSANGDEGDPGEYAHTGNWLAELDNTGSDAIRQTVDLAAQGAPIGADQAFLFQFWYAKQDANKNGQLHVVVQERDSSSNLGPPLLDIPLSVTSRTYQDFRQVLKTVNPDTTHLRVLFEWVGGRPPDDPNDEEDPNDDHYGGSILIDDVYLFDANALINDGWKLQPRGTAAARMDWAVDVEPYHGTYCIQAEVYGADETAANCVRIHPVQNGWAQVRDRTSHIIKVRVRGEVGLQLRLGIQRRGAGGSARYSFSDPLTIPASDGWYTLSDTLSTGGATEIRPIIELRSNGVYGLDAVEMYEASIDNRTIFLDGENLVHKYRVGDYRDDLLVHDTDDTMVRSFIRSFTRNDIGLKLIILSGTGWTPGTYTIHNVVRVHDVLEETDVDYAVLYDAEDVDPAPPAAVSTAGGVGVATELPDLSVAALTSIHTYGLRETVLEVGEIEDLDRAADYVTGYFNAHAIPAVQGRISLDACDVHLRYVDIDEAATPLGMVRVAGPGVSIPDQFPARIVYSVDSDGLLHCEVDLTQRRPDPALLLAQALGKGRGDGGSSGSAGGGTNLGNGSGGHSSGGDEGTAPITAVNGGEIGARGTVDHVADFGAEIEGADDEDGDTVTLTFRAKPADFHQFGETAERPEPDEVPEGTYWTSSNEDDGTTYRSNGVDAWQQIAGPVTRTGSGEVAGMGITFGGWRRVNIGANTETSFTQMGALDGLPFPDPQPYDGDLVALGVSLDDELNTGKTYEVEVYRSTDGGATFSGTGLVALVDGDAATAYGRRNATATGSYGVNADDLLSAYDRRTGSITGRSARVFYVVRPS